MTAAEDDLLEEPPFEYPEPEPRPEPVMFPLPAMPTVFPLGPISDRQFAHALWKQNVITLDEAMAFVKVGELPAALSALLAALPADQRDDAELLIAGSTTLERLHPFTAILSEAFGWTDEVTDEFWRVAAAL